ncbi:MAG: AbrB/MazE/SpoVT family DNA-binding domain-containing protein [Candidatus Omnitrophica bacterium]|nr:AbrB/MazE/SpoVT family DNA-binding domain-containing protein [Candidatus Omnitrophota bacterium]
MIKHLTSHGNSSALIIEKAILELLKIDLKTPLEVTTDGQNLIVSPVKGSSREKKLKAALVKINKRHAKTLKALAQ